MYFSFHLYTTYGLTKELMRALIFYFIFKIIKELQGTKRILLCCSNSLESEKLIPGISRVRNHEEIVIFWLIIGVMTLIIYEMLL